MSGPAVLYGNYLEMAYLSQGQKVLDLLLYPYLQHISFG